MTLNDEKWGDLREKVFEKFPEACETKDFVESEDDLGQKFEIKIETLTFTSPFGELKIERETRPKIIDKKAHYHKGSGGAKVEYIFSKEEFTYKVAILKKDEISGDWQPLEISPEQLSF